MIGPNRADRLQYSQDYIFKALPVRIKIRQPIRGFFFCKRKVDPPMFFFGGLVASGYLPTVSV
jgi:hypothetical protein